MAECLRKGYLLKCPQKARAFKKWNSRWFVLYGNSPRGRVRLEYYDSEKAWQQERGKRIIPLVHCVSIKPVWDKDYNNVLELVTSDKTFYLGAGSKDEEKAWFKSLCKVVFGNSKRNSIVHVLDRPDPFDMGYHSLDRGTDAESNLSRSQSSTLAQSSPQLSKIIGSREKLGLDSTITSDLNTTSSSTDTMSRNAISSLSCELSSLVSFESGFDDAASVVSSVVSSIPEVASRFHVTVRPTIASQEAGMSGQYILQISSTKLTLLELGTENAIAEWQIQHLRRYGRGRTKFSFEAGDKCKTGIGVYTFNTTEGDQIFHLIDMHARKLSLQNKDTKEKRILLPTDSFRPLNETRRRAKSEGKLLDSSDDSTINELSESLEQLSTSGKAVLAPSAFPSKGRACTLDVIKDQEPAEKPVTPGSPMRPRSRTDVSMERELMKKALETQEQNLARESTESLLQNPASTDFVFGGSTDTVKEQPEELNVKTNIDTNGINLKVEDNEVLEQVGPATVVDSVDGGVKEEGKIKNELKEIDGSKMQSQTQNCEELEDDLRVSAKSPFEPLSTSEQAESPKNDNSETGKLIENNLVEIDGPYKQPLNDESSKIENNAPLESNVERASLRRGDEEETTEKEKPVSKRKKTRKLAQRNKSFEFGSMSEKTYDNKKHSGSFSSFDYRKYRDNNEPIYKTESGSRKLQRFASVKKTVEMYEKLSTAASEARQKSFTLWKRRSFRSSQKPEVSKRTNESST